MKAHDFLANQIDGKFTFKHPQAYRRYQQQLKNGSYKVSITRMYPPKTCPQLGYYYAVVVEAVKDDMIEQTGKEFIEYVCAGEKFQQKIDTKFVDKYIKRHCARISGDNLCISVENDTREIHNKRNMSKIKAMQLLDNSIKWCADELHIVIPSPTE